MRVDAQRNRDKILAVTEQLLKKDNSQALTMAQVAQAAHIGVGTIYRKFPTKGDLLLALAYNRLEGFLEKHQYLLQKKDITRLDVEQTIADYIAFREQRMKLSAGGFESALKYYQRQNYRRLHKLFRHLIRSQSPQMDYKTAAFRADMLIAMLRSDSYSLQRSERGLAPQEIVAQIMLLFFGN